MLAPSAIFVTVNLVYLGVARVRQKLMDIVLIPGAVALGTLTLSYVLIPPLDLVGPAVAWLVSNGVVAIAVLPRLAKFLRSKEASVP